MKGLPATDLITFNEYSVQTPVSAKVPWKVNALIIIKSIQPHM